jgi:predicted MFS family arabinose efflux permease
MGISDIEEVSRPWGFSVNDPLLAVGHVNPVAEKPVAIQRVPGSIQGIALLLPVTLAVMGIIVLVPVVPQMMAHFSSVPNHEYLVLGGVLTMPALGLTLFSPLVGWIVDRLGRKPVLIAAMIAYVALGTAPIFMDNLFVIIGTRVGVGLCEAGIMTASTTLLCDYFTGEAREKWLGAQTAVASLSSIVLVFAGGALGSLYGWRGPFGIYLIGLIFVAAIIRLVWEPTRGAAAGPVATATSKDLPVPATFSWARLIGICAITVVASIMFYLTPTQSGIALTSLGVTDPLRIGVLTACAILGVPVGTLIFQVVRRWPITTLLFLEFALIGAGFILMGRASSPGGFIAAAAINQVGSGMILPTLITWATRDLAFEIRGRGTGLWTASFFFGQFLCGLVISMIASIAGGLAAAFQLVGIIALASAVPAIVCRLTLRRSVAPHT